MDFPMVSRVLSTMRWKSAFLEFLKRRARAIKRRQWEDELNALRKKLDVELAWAVIDKKDNTADAKMLIAGDSRRPGKTVPRGFLSIITSEKPDIPENQSGRLQLAQWIASPKNPLTARVMANRIWQYHFGTGIVATSNGFGTQGKPPSHPKLLDFPAGLVEENDSFGPGGEVRLFGGEGVFEVLGVAECLGDRAEKNAIKGAETNGGVCE